jgi:mono/diheme cytochrome c family protein
MYKGDREGFDEGDLAEMEKRKGLSHIRTPDQVEDNLEKGIVAGGEKVFGVYCAACHQSDGKGASGRFPPLAGTDWVTGDKERLINIVLNGIDGPIVVNGETYINAMPQHGFLSDQEVANVLTYIRQNFGNKASEVTAAEVSRVRDKKSPGRIH